MPPFPERESSLLAKLKKKKGASDKDDKDLDPPAPAATPSAQPIQTPNSDSTQQAKV